MRVLPGHQHGAIGAAYGVIARGLREHNRLLGETIRVALALQLEGEQALLELLVRFSGVYGRQRLAAAMLIALAIRYPVVSFGGEVSLWLGWVVPGLVGADMQRQGVLTTLAGALAVGSAAAMTVYLLQGWLT